MDKIITEIKNNLGASDLPINKLLNLNNSEFLNSYLKKGNYKPVLVAVNELLDNVDESDVNALNSYQEELTLIFNL